jgi:hypothetical protein
MLESFVCIKHYPLTFVTIFKGLDQMSCKKLQHMFTIKANGCWIWRITASRSYTSALVQSSSQFNWPLDATSTWTKIELVYALTCIDPVSNVVEII